VPPPRPLDFRPRCPLLPNRRQGIGLDIADPPTNLLILRVASRVPKGARILVVKCDKCRNPSYSSIAEVALSRAGKAQADALTAIVLVDSKSVDVPAPTVPASNNHPDNLLVSLGYEKGGWSVQDKAFNVLPAIRGAGMLTTSKRPKT
jgi:hypothetical protein